MKINVKRACVQWGIGRFLYRLGVVTLKTQKHTNGKEYPATDSGKILWSNDEITEYIRTRNSKASKPSKSSSKRYEKTTTPPKYNSNQYTEETIKRVGELEVDGIKGKACLIKYLDDFAKKEGKDYKKLSELDDEALNKLMDFLDNLPPADV